MPADNEIRIEIAETWSASEFSELLAQLDFLYQVARFGQLRIDGQSALPFPLWSLYHRRPWYPHPYFDAGENLEEEARLRRRFFERMIRDVLPRTSEPLEIKRIQFSSPGLVDLAGVGKAAHEFRLFILGVIDRFLRREDRRIARESATQDLIAKKIKNAENLIRIGEKVGLDQETRQGLLLEVLSADYFIEGKIVDKKIIAIK